MRLKSKVLVLFLSAITLSMFLFLLFCYDVLHNGYYSGINENQMKQVLYEAEDELQQIDEADHTAVKQCIKRIEEKHADMYLAVIENGEWMSLEDLPQVASYKEIINLSFEQAGICEKYKVSARATENINGIMVILCYVPLDKMEALSYKVNLARGSGVFGKIAIVGIGMTLVIMIFFLWLFSKKFFKRIQDMNAVIESFSNDHMDIRMNTEGTDEMAHIAKAFNAMADRLEKSYQEKERYESNRKKLVSDISHDLRTPLSSVLGYAEMLQNEIYDSEEEKAQFIDIIHRKAVYMEELLSELLEYSRLEMGTLVLNKVSMNITEMIRQILIEYIPSFEREHYALEVELPETAVVGQWDEIRLRRVMHNVIGNALKYGMAGKKLLIQLMEEQNDVTLIIKDYGNGIDEEDLKYIKERFYRGDRARNSKIGGMGIGMYITDEIIRLHGGEFLIESQKGQGTTVKIKLMKK